MMGELDKLLLNHGLKVCLVEGKGRSLVAAKDFSPGEVIYSQEPYVSVPNDTSNSIRCDGCFVSGNIKKCSACKIVWFCGSACQKSEWKLHQLECRALLRLTEDRRKLITPSIRLMVKIFLRRKLQHDRVIQVSPTDNYHLVEALVDHISDIGEQKLVMYAQMANLVSLILPSFEINLKEITQTFSKLSCNAHTVCDSQMRPLGTGLYPVVSMINHSCLPNTVLIFDGKLATVRVVRSIAKGAELTLSYAETAASTTTRLKVLQEQYFFTCDCCRCIKVGQEEDLVESALLEGYRCKIMDCDGLVLLTFDEAYLCQKCGVSWDKYEIRAITNEAEHVSNKASASLSFLNHHEASILYRTLEQLQIKLFHPLSINLMRTRETILKILMEMENWMDSLTYCRLTLPVYERVYPEYHPLRGLQYYTCGKLAWLLGETIEAVESFTKAADILRITHGSNSLFVKELFGRLEEARAEAAYRNSS